MTTSKQITDQPLDSKHDSVTLASGDREIKKGNGRKHPEKLELNSGAEAGRQNPLTRWWQKRSLLTKAILTTVALGTLPVLAIGGLSYYVVDRDLVAALKRDKLALTSSLNEKVNRFLLERFGDIQSWATLPAFTNPRVRSALSPQEQQQFMQNLLGSTLLYYDSLALYDLNANLLASAGPAAAPKNIGDREYFQQAKAGKANISETLVSKTTNDPSLFFAAPVKDTVTGKVIAVLRSRVPTAKLGPLLEEFSQGGNQFRLINEKGTVLVASDPNQLGEAGLQSFLALTPAFEAKEPQVVFTFNQTEKKPQVATYAPVKSLEGLPDLGWGSIIAIDQEIALKAERDLLLTLVIGAGGLAIALAVLGTIIARRATRPILAATEAVVKLGSGDLETRLQVTGEDELAQLGTNINTMAGQLQTFLTEQQATAERERARSEALQRELIALLSDVEGATQGDLTVRAQITSGEIGIVADFFNAIVESLRDVVTQVKRATTQVSSSVTANDAALRDLSAEAIAQAEQLNEALQAVEVMTESFSQVAENAKQAAVASSNAANTAESSSVAIEHSVESILQLRQTVSETAKTVKRLGEASQQISKVVALIDQIALKTNMLAVNASIEAARAGEEGRGFAVVAEEVGALAAQSATATKEIERIVETIQQETSEVVAAMEASTEQVVEGTRQVETARQNLSQIVAAARQVDQLFQDISSATVSQAEISQSVQSLMAQLAATSQRSSQTSQEVSEALQKTVGVASQLEASVETFKVAAG